MNKYLPTRIEDYPVQEIGTAIDMKIEELKAKNLPIEQGLCDYIALSLENIDNEVKTLKKYKKELDLLIKTKLEHKKEAMSEIAKKLKDDLGLEKLQGMSVSSIRIKPENVSFTKKFVLDEDKDELVELGYAHYEDVIKEIPMSIKINKRRSKNDTDKQ